MLPSDGKAGHDCTCDRIALGSSFLTLSCVTICIPSLGAHSLIVYRALEQELKRRDRETSIFFA